MAKAKDPRYGAIKVLVNAGHIKKLSDVFINMPPTVVMTDLNTNYNSYIKMTENPGIIRADRIVRMAELFELEPAQVMTLIHEEIKHQAQKRRPGK